jgi:NADPH:quinone reductase-like Zn-dependent oxidoreductase
MTLFVSLSCLILLQILKSWGAFRVVTCAPYRVVQLARMLGADHVIPAMPDHQDTEEKCRRELTEMDVTFDAAVVTSDVLSVDFCSKYSVKVASAMNKNAATAETSWFWRMLGKGGGEERRRKKMNVSNLMLLSSLVDGGELQPVLDVSYPIERFDEAFDRVAAAEQAVGKVVVRLN